MAEKSRIIQDVKIILDENEKVYGTLDLGGEIADPDQLETDTLIARLIPMAIDAVAKVAGIDYLAGMFSRVSAADIKWETYEDNCMKATLPEDFIRVGYVKLGGWKRGVSSFLAEDDPLYAEFFSDLAGVRPTKVFPGAAIVVSETPGCFDLVCCPKGDASEGSMLYIGTADTSDEAESYDISSKCYDAVLYYIAHLYYVTLNESDRAAMMEAESYKRLDLQTASEKGDVQ